MNQISSLTEALKKRKEKKSHWFFRDLEDDFPVYQTIWGIGPQENTGNSVYHENISMCLCNENSSMSNKAASGDVLHREMYTLKYTFNDYLWSSWNREINKSKNIQHYNL